MDAVGRPSMPLALGCQICFLFPSCLFNLGTLQGPAVALRCLWWPEWSESAGLGDVQSRSLVPRKFW